MPQSREEKNPSAAQSPKALGSVRAVGSESCHCAPSDAAAGSEPNPIQRDAAAARLGMRHTAAVPIPRASAPHSRAQLSDLDTYLALGV